MEYHTFSWITHGYLDRNGLQTNWIYAMDIHRYRSDVIPNVCHKLFNSVCMFNFRCHHTLSVYYHHLTVTVISVIRLTGYITLLFARYAPFAPFIFTLRPSLTV